MREVWGWTFGDQSTVTVHVRRLREKVEDDPAQPDADPDRVGRRLPARPAVNDRPSAERLATSLLWAAVGARSACGCSTWPLRRRSVGGLLLSLDADRHGGVGRRDARRRAQHAAADRRRRRCSSLDRVGRRSLGGRCRGRAAAARARATGGRRGGRRARRRARARPTGTPAHRELRAVRDRAAVDRRRAARVARARAGAGARRAASWWRGSATTCAPRWPGCARWPRRSRTASPTTRALLQADRRVGRPARPAWSTTCSTCRASRPARSRGAPSRSSDELVDDVLAGLRPLAAGQAASSSRPTPAPRSSCAATRPNSTGRSPISSRTRSGTPPKAARSTCTLRPDAERSSRSASPTSAAASRMTCCRGCSRSVTAATPRRAATDDGGRRAGPRDHPRHHRGARRVGGVGNTETGCRFRAALPAG